MAANQSTPDSNRGLSSIFWWLRRENHVKFTKECLMCTKKHVLGLVWFYGISTIVGYLMPNLVFTYILNI